MAYILSMVLAPKSVHASVRPVPPFVTAYVFVTFFPHGLLAMLEVCSDWKSLCSKTQQDNLLVPLSSVKKMFNPQLF